MSGAMHMESLGRWIHLLEPASVVPIEGERAQISRRSGRDLLHNICVEEWQIVVSWSDKVNLVVEFDVDLLTNWEREFSFDVESVSSPLSGMCGSVNLLNSLQIVKGFKPHFNLWLCHSLIHIEFQCCGWCCCHRFNFQCNFSVRGENGNFLLRVQFDMVKGLLSFMVGSSECGSVWKTCKWRRSKNIWLWRLEHGGLPLAASILQTTVRVEVVYSLEMRGK
mmetsp:Transcript_3395/g.12908  ORF Transcript_3395/g.12908 Transcript_3395/m.12908 type:complete len:222 (+) Transcript_3395:442-1107(+)